MNPLKQLSADKLTSLVAVVLQCLVMAGTAQDKASFEQGKQSVVAETVASAQQLYREANFDLALHYLGRAKRLAPDDPNVAALTRACELAAAQKRAALKQAPQDPTRLKRQIESLYEEGVKKFQTKDYKGATEALETVWLLAGNYRDTWKYLPQARKAGPIAPTTVNPGQGAEKAGPVSPTPVAAPAAPVPNAEALARQQAEEQERQRQAALTAALQQGKDLQAAHQWDAAQAAFQKALELDPKNRTASRALSQIEDQRKAEAEALARQQAEAAERARQEQIRQVLEQAQQLTDSKQWDAAQSAYEKVLQLDTGNRRATNGLRQIARERQAETERLQAEQEAKERAQQAALAEEEERRRKALEESERVKKAAVAEALTLGRSHLKDERFDAAEQAYKNALALDPNSTAAAEGLANVEKARAAFAERQRQEQEAALKAHREKKIREDLAFAASQFKAGQLDKAIQTYQNILSEDPNNRVALRELDRIKAGQERERAEAEQRRAEWEAQQRKERVNNKLAAAREQENAGRYDQAAAIYREALAEDAENRTALRGIERCRKAIESQQAVGETASPGGDRPSFFGRIAGVFRRDTGKAEDTENAAAAVSPTEVPSPLTAPATPAPDMLIPTTLMPGPAAPVVPVSPPAPPVEAVPAPQAQPQVPALAQARQAAQAKYDQAQNLIAQGQYAQAITVLSEALQADSSFDPARQQIRELQAMLAQLEAARQAAEAEAQRAKEIAAAAPAPKAAETPKSAPPTESEKPAAPAAPKAAKKAAEKPKAEPPAPAPQEEQRKADEVAEAQRKQIETTVAGMIADARNLLNERKWDEAEKKVREALVLSPDNAMAKAVLADLDKARSQASNEAVKASLAQANALMDKGDYAGAVAAYEAILRSDPQNAEAQRQYRRAKERLDTQQAGVTAKRESARAAQAERLLSEGMAAYRAKDIQTAVQKWKEVLMVDPSNAKAANYLKETDAEYQEFLKQEEIRKTQAAEEAAAAAKLEEKITIEVKEGTKLREFLDTLSFVTGINFTIVQGADALVVAKFEDKRLREILDTVLPPNGLIWKRQGDIITIMPDLQTKVFHLDSDLLLIVRRLYESGELQRILWGADTPPIKGIELTIDERQAVMILTDTPRNIIKTADFLQQYRDKAPPKLITKIYSVREDLADSIKTLVEAILKTEQQKPPYELARKVILARHEGGADLVVKDTEENIRKIEELLSDPKFQMNLEQADLEVYTTNLTPRDVLTQNDEQVKAFGAQVVEVVSAMLYHKEGESAARQQGRRMWYDPDTLQLTLIDTPANIKKVSDFIEALPQLEPRMRSKIIYLEYAIAGDLASQLEQVLGIAAGTTAATGAAAGTEASFSLRVEDERTFRDLSVRLVRVDENNFADENDDSIQLVVRTRTAQSSDLSVPEFRSEIFEDYEIYVERVDPSPTIGEGRARIRVSYRPELGTGETTLPPDEMAAEPPPEPAAGAPTTLEITPFEELNALLVRYQNPSEFAELEAWIKQLDIAVLQVQIETKFVEVNETVAKEFSSDIQWLNVGQEGIVFDDSVLNMRFAQDADEFRTGLEPPIEYTQNASLLKGVTVLDLITGGQSPLHYRLRFLEEEGLLNVVSGPTITVLNTQQATFQITRTGAFGGLFGGFGGFPGIGGIGGIGGFPGMGGYGGIGGIGGYGGYGGIGGIGGYGGYGGMGGIGGYGGFGGFGGFGGGGQLVDMEVTPNATRRGQITLDIDINLTSDQFDIGQMIQQGVLGQALQPYTIVNTAQQPSQIYRTLQTSARVKDGGTIVLGGWTYERTRDATSGIPVLRGVPYLGKLLFGRNSRISEKTNLLIFLTAKIVD